MAQSGVQIIGLKEFRAALSALGADWPKELRQVHEELANREARASRATAGGMGGVRAKAAGGIRGTADQRGASIGVGGSPPFAAVAFWGAKRHSGWYAKAQYEQSPPQHPKWVGNSWEAAVAGQGPYAINATLARDLHKIVERYGEMIDEIAKVAFPGR